jgi:hypothetical protein
MSRIAQREMPVLGVPATTGSGRRQHSAPAASATPILRRVKHGAGKIMKRFPYSANYLNVPKKQQ